MSNLGNMDYNQIFRERTKNFSILVIKSLIITLFR